jgi:hypothetical protein
MLFSIDQFCERNPAFRPGGLRHLVFHKGQELARHGVVVRFGRRLLINETKFFEFLNKGGAAKIGGSNE